jgi:hypothetical protein
VRHANAAIREGRWKLVWPGDEASLRKDSGRDNPSYLRGVVMPHWEMPLDRQLDPPSTDSLPPPRLYDLQTDPAEQRDLSASHPEIVKLLSEKHDLWFNEVIADWQQSRARIVAQDCAYWKNRTAPDPNALFEAHWQWKAAPSVTNPRTADPLTIFQGFWSNAPEE